MKPTQELIKTAGFLGAAALLATAGYFATAAPTYEVSTETVNQDFYEFDSGKITQLRIVSFNPATSTVVPFEVQKQNEVWVLPSHEFYPADASTRLGEALGQIQALRRGPLVSESPLDFDRYGVVSPENIKPGTPPDAVGTLVVAKTGGETKASVVIGAAVEKDRADFRYIRRADEDRVYRAKIDMSKLSTKFEDWIETDLLEVGAVSLKQVDFDNFTVDEQRGRVVPVEQFRVTYDESKPAEQRWGLVEMKEPADDAPKGTLPTFTPVDLAAQGKELNATKLNDMQRAFNDLKIVDVHRKPEKIIQILNGQAVQVNQFEQEQILTDLQAKGFYFTQGQIIPLEGQVAVGLEDGVQYLLKFGRIAGQEDAKAGDAADAKNKFRRYLFIAAHFNEELIPKPEYETYTPKGATPAAPGPNAPAPNAEAKPAEAPAAPAPAPAPSGEAAATTPDAEDADESLAALDGCQDSTAAPAAAPAPAANPAPAAPASTGAAPAAAPADPEKARIDSANAAKKTAYEKKLADGKKRADDLNRRFANWYYVISSDVYDKVRLGQKQIVKVAGASDDAAAPGDEAKQGETPEAFRDLKNPLGQ